VIQKPVKEGNLRRYLLGTLPEEELAGLESLYFASDEVFEDLLAEEDDLVDAYVADELPLDERSRFDKLLPGSSRLRNRVETARALRRWKGPSRRDLPVGALLLAATVILALGVFWAVRKPRPASEMAANATPIPSAVVPATSVPATGGPRRVFSYVLAAGLTRDASEATTVAIPKGTETVELRLPLETDAFSSYDVRLRTEGGKDVLERRGLRSRKERMGPVVAVEVPAQSLPSGTYVLTLSGQAGRGTTETLDQYIFRVPAR
jgi:hypothetical protein